MLRKSGITWKHERFSETLDKANDRAYNGDNFIETVEAEITAKNAITESLGC